MICEVTSLSAQLKWAALEMALPAEGSGGSRWRICLYSFRKGEAAPKTSEQSSPSAPPPRAAHSPKQVKTPDFDAASFLFTREGTVKEPPAEQLSTEERAARTALYAVAPLLVGVAVTSAVSAAVVLSGPTVPLFAGTACAAAAGVAALAATVVRLGPP